MKRIIKNISATFGLLFLLNACGKGNSDYTSTAIPYVAINITMNANTYPSLAPVGGVAYLSNVGYRGIMLYRLSASTIMAYDQACTYDISNTSGIVYAQTNGTALCLECNSVYNLNNGSVNTGPTTIGLTVYPTTFNPTTGVLTIKN
jgi:nitrite reductase/ring-hydroxylating ferredoxin subunit